ncbi:ferredoxin [Nocardia callitridis]|uniref:Ferredoxin n=1 Tax=Nocardia callitridis TaxID=648753 RepID=A0ABP9K5J0_9NOCA
MRIEADRARCEGHGMCEALAPGWFQLDDAGIVQAPSDPVDSDAELAALIIDSCPVQALRLG